MSDDRCQIPEPRNQGELFETQETPSGWPSPERARARLYKILDDLRRARSLPWESGRASLYRTVFPQMCRYLPDDEAGRLLHEFAVEMARLDRLAEPSSRSEGGETST